MEVRAVPKVEALIDATIPQPLRTADRMKYFDILSSVDFIPLLSWLILLLPSLLLLTS